MTLTVAQAFKVALDLWEIAQEGQSLTQPVQTTTVLYWEQKYKPVRLHSEFGTSNFSYISDSYSLIYIRFYGYHFKRWIFECLCIVVELLVTVYHNLLTFQTRSRKHACAALAQATTHRQRPTRTHIPTPTVSQVQPQPEHPPRSLMYYTLALPLLVYITVGYYTLYTILTVLYTATKVEIDKILWILLPFLSLLITQMFYQLSYQFLTIKRAACTGVNS